VSGDHTNSDPGGSTSGGLGGQARFGRPSRLTHAREFQAAFAGRVSRTRGPLAVYASPRARAADSARLGLSVSRRVGSAVTRNRIKRRLREAFRLNRHALPTGVDLVVAVRPHEPLPMADYARLLVDAARALAEDLRRKAARAGGRGAEPPPAKPGSRA